MGYARKAGVQTIQRLVSDKYKMRHRDVDAVLQGVPKHLHPDTVLLKEADTVLLKGSFAQRDCYEVEKTAGIRTC